MIAYFGLYIFSTLGPAKGDIKMVVQECMLGLGEFTVDKPKTLCIAGPLNNGKKLLSQIIAFEIGKVSHKSSI